MDLNMGLFLLLFWHWGFQMIFIFWIERTTFLKLSHHSSPSPSLSASPRLFLWFLRLLLLTRGLTGCPLLAIPRLIFLNNLLSLVAIFAEMILLLIILVNHSRDILQIVKRLPCILIRLIAFPFDFILNSIYH